jgi:hypothetical protein
MAASSVGRQARQGRGHPDVTVPSGPEGSHDKGEFPASEHRSRGVPMPRYLVIGNQTLGSVELREELRKRFEADPNSFFLVLVPNTYAVDYHGVPVAGGFVPMPTLIMASGPATDEEATALAQHQLDQLLKRVRELGVQAEGELGDPDPLKAIGEVLARDQFDEVIISTLPQRVSRWLHTDLPYKVQRRFDVPVTTITAT